MEATVNSTLDVMEDLDGDMILIDGVQVEVVDFKLNDDDDLMAFPTTTEDTNESNRQEKEAGQLAINASSPPPSLRRSIRAGKSAVNYAKIAKGKLPTEVPQAASKPKGSSSNDLPRVRRFKCKHCGKRLANKHSFLRHEATFHGSSLPYVCGKASCGKAFVEKHSLAIHELTHSGVKAYSCDECGRGFSQISHLNRHRRQLHNGDRPHVCSICARGFAEAETLAQHVYNHSLVKAFKCYLCGGAFINKPVLKRHLRSHTGERPYACSVCNRTFSILANAKRHEKTIHNI